VDKNAIKKYAIWARRELIEKVTQKAQQFGIEEGKDADPDADSINGVLLSDTQKEQRGALIEKTRQDVFQQVMEEVAYTWFNRFIALRFMEVNGYLPSHVRVFTDDNNQFHPQILTEAIHLDFDGLDMEKVYAMKEANQDEELFKYLLIVQCNNLNSILPGMFQKIADYTELLLPDYLLREGSVIERMIAQIDEKDWDIRAGGQIEIIGWLYQYYISEKHEKVVDTLHGKVIKKDEVPAATQLFTTDWVVRYLIDNSVGRYWVERNPESKLEDELTYFVKPKDGNVPRVDEKIAPQDLTVFDPCVGSGHFLVYAFDVLMKIYVEYGYSERDAASEIVKNNLFGLDIDSRAVQLAYFAVMMTARKYDRRFFRREIQPHIYEITESNNADPFAIQEFCDKDTALEADVQTLLDTFHDAKEYGSIIKIPEINFERIRERLKTFESGQKISMYHAYLTGAFKNFVSVAELMSNKYAVVATNPPYLNKFDTKLKKFITSNYKDYKGDLFSVFMYRNFGFCEKNGYSGFMTPMVWMFIKTYELLRRYIFESKHITTLIQFEYSAFEEATVPICTFVFKNGQSDNKGYYFRLSDFKGGMDVQNEKTLEALENKECGYYYEADQSNFSKIPGSPVAYWIKNYAMFDFSKLDNYIDARLGMVSGNNDRFIRLWTEVKYLSIEFSAKPNNDPHLVKWYPLQKGGDYRKWYGNLSYVINWENDGYEIKYDNYAGQRVRSHNYNGDKQFRRGITWNSVTSSKFQCRYSPEGFTYNMAGPLCEVKDDRYLASVLGFLSCKVTNYIFSATNPTINFLPGYLEVLPFSVDGKRPCINGYVSECIIYSKSDWDSFETSWDFQIHPFIIAHKEHEGEPENNLVATGYQAFKQECEDRFCRLKSNEEELNRIFIDIYGLQEELTPEESDGDVTVARVYDEKEDIPEDMKNNKYVLTRQDVIKSFLSYAVGCMFGRYSLDEEGLAYAGGDWDASKYHSFIPDEDNIIPICDDEYFTDDIVGRFVKFVEVVYGKDTLEENLKFIADSLGNKGNSPREVIRNYFLKDFYKDHCKTYQKRPIYWLFDSGKKNGFKCLIYMHRYQPDTIARIRTDYVHEQQSRYRTAIAGIEQRLLDASGSEHVKLNKQLKKLEDQAEETRIYEEKIHHLADQMISIDLDDGVKHNYAIFQDVLAKIK
jgi:type II restriction/modification system DNA methylase subunit YeeA